YTDSSTAANNFLQVALLQDNILGPQGGASLNPDQVINGQYNHMHMFRANITGNTWGDTIYTTDSGSFVSKTYTYNLPATISGVNVLPFDLEVLAFITESKTDVLNVCKADIAYENASASVISMNPLDFEGCDMEFPTFVTVYNPLEDTVRSLDIKYGIHGSSSATCTRTGIMILPNQRDTFHLPMLIGNYNSGTDYAGYAKVTSVNGTSVNSDSLNCSLLKNSKNAAGHMLTFRLTTDRYGSETTYKFMKNDGTVLSSGGPYTNSVQTYNIALIVPEDGCYRLEVYDSEGDGINGGYGNGSFSLSDNNGLVFTDNGQFTAKSQYFLNITHTDGLMGAQLVDFSLYPNPVKNTLHIECGQDIEKAEIFDMQGKMVLSQENANDINVSILAKGSYILRVATKDGAAVHSFVKE
ncbi:MAG: Omp28-related outer membrane protein, partial [Bacteroidales bacterium]|nr:Omp28-related outer membrane protein [Bacteroidales bacterium]